MNVSYGGTDVNSRSHLTTWFESNVINSTPGENDPPMRNESSPESRRRVAEKAIPIIEQAMEAMPTQLHEWLFDLLSWSCAHDPDFDSVLYACGLINGSATASAIDMLCTTYRADRPIKQHSILAEWFADFFARCTTKLLDIGEWKHLPDDLQVLATKWLGHQCQVRDLIVLMQDNQRGVRWWSAYHLSHINSAGEMRVVDKHVIPNVGSIFTRITKAGRTDEKTVSSYGEGVRAQVFEVIVRQALAGAPWREICAGPMKVNAITEYDVYNELARRCAILEFRIDPRYLKHNYGEEMTHAEHRAMLLDIEKNSLDALHWCYETQTTWQTPQFSHAKKVLTDSLTYLYSRVPADAALSTLMNAATAAGAAGTGNNAIVPGVDASGAAVLTGNRAADDSASGAASDVASDSESMNDAAAAGSANANSVAVDPGAADNTVVAAISIVATIDSAAQVLADKWQKILGSTGTDKQQAEKILGQWYSLWQGTPLPERVIWCQSPAEALVVAATTMDTHFPNKGDLKSLELQYKLERFCALNRGIAIPLHSQSFSSQIPVISPCWEGLRLFTRRSNVRFAGRIQQLIIQSASAEASDVLTSRSSRLISDSGALIRLITLFHFSGQFESDWLIGLETSDGERQSPLCNLLSAAAQHCGFWWAFKDSLVVCEKPEVLQFDERSLLHNESGPALKYSDGWCLYSIHGVQVPPHVIHEPEKISVEMIETESNVELRRVLIDRYGLERYIRNSAAMVIHENERGVLYLKEIREDQPLVMVKVFNSTPEPDGTRREYFLRVPPDVRTVQQAVAWTFGMEAADYDPTMET